MWPDRVSNPGPLTYESGALPIVLRGPAIFLKAPENDKFNMEWLNVINLTDLQNPIALRQSFGHSECNRVKIEKLTTVFLRL